MPNEVYNVFGQRYHPYGNPYDFKHLHNNGVIAAPSPNYISKQGNQGGNDPN